MVDISVNYFGKLMELGQKCKFVVDPEVVDDPSSKGFKCILRIPNYEILVEKTAANKKAAKSAAAQIAFEKICQKIEETAAASIDKIAIKLKELEVTSDKKVSAIEFGKKLASLDLSTVSNSYSDINDLVSSIQCTLTYDYGETTLAVGSVECYFICEVRPSGALSPAVSGFGWSTDGLNEAKSQAVNQLLALLKVYSSKKIE